MKTEDFDKAIRQKLEEVQCPVQERDIEQIFKYVHQHRIKKAFWRRRPFAIAGALLLSVFVILSAVFISDQQKKDKAIALGQNQNGKAVVPSVARPIVRDSTKSIAHSRVLNVAAVKTGNIVRKAVSSSLSSGALIAGRTIITGAVHTANVEKNSADTFAVAALPIIEPVATPVQAAKAQPEKKREIPSADSKHSDSLALKTVPINENKLPESSADKTKNADKIKSASALYNFFAGKQYAIGLGFSMADEQLSAGLEGEMLLAEHWSLNAGIRILRMADEQFDDDSDFKIKKGRDFFNFYGPYLRDTAGVSNINRYTLVLQLPLTLTYRYPLRKSFTVLLGLGIDLDLYAKEYLQYDVQSGNTLINKKMEVRYPTVLVNDLVFSAGIGKQWRHLLVHAVPFISPQLSSVIYKPENLYLGCTLRFFYSLN